jgi:hypothetical protein
MRMHRLPPTSIQDTNFFFPAVDCEIDMPPGIQLGRMGTDRGSVVVGSAKGPQIPGDQWFGRRISLLRDIHILLTRP